MTSETRYMRSDQRTIYGLTGYKLDTTQSTTFTVEEEGVGGSVTVYFRAKVSVRHNDNSETLIQDWFALFSRSSDGEGYQSCIWNCPQTTVVPTDVVVVRIRITILGISLDVAFVTDQLGATQLNAVTWVFTIYTYRLYEYRYTYGSIFFGNSTYNSRIENFTWSSGPPPPPAGGILVQII